MYLERLKLMDRVAFVTGGASGIGLCAVEALAEAGAHVVIADLKQDAIDAAIRGLAAKGYVAEGVVMDVTDSAAVSKVADDLVARLGRIDILINNAGIARSEISAEEMED